MWTEEDENKWRLLTKKRESHKEEIGKIQLIKSLRELADKIEDNDQNLTEFNIQYIRAEQYSYEGPPPIIARVITVRLPGNWPD